MILCFYQMEIVRKKKNLKMWMKNMFLVRKMSAAQSHQNLGVWEHEGRLILLNGVISKSEEQTSPRIYISLYRGRA